ncbi:MAG TPA: CpaD family pilus assembly protein [Xanthobacteraceae bacterium]|jgi:pilus assembly protein CpaD
MSTINSAAARRRGGAYLRLLAIAGCAAVLTGCNTVQEVTGAVPLDSRQRHPIVINEGPRLVELFIGDKRGILNGSQRGQVLAFAGEWHRESTGGIRIDVPEGTSNAKAAASAAQEARSILVAAGVPSGSIALHRMRPINPGKMATLRLSYPRMTADAGPCGLWPHDLGPTWDREHYENLEYWNFGCAQQRNLAAMVEDPADLVEPRGETPPYTGRRDVVLDKYRQGQSTVSIDPNADKGKITNIGQ